MLCMLVKCFLFISVLASLDTFPTHISFRCSLLGFSVCNWLFLFCFCVVYLVCVVCIYIEYNERSLDEYRLGG